MGNNTVLLFFFPRVGKSLAARSAALSHTWENTLRHAGLT